jgi:methionyl-tRNA formyltransferase
VRVLVMAYQDIGYVCLDELLALGADVAAVVTHRDDANGETIWFRSVAERARRAGLPVLEPESVNRPAVMRELARLAPDMIFSFYFREILAPEVLRLAPRGAFNLHGSLLPRYRGRCPVNWVLVNGEHETGVTLHHMEARPDAGDIVAQRAVPITDDDTALTLNKKLGDAARGLLRATFPRLVAGTAARVPQDHSRASYFGGRRPDDGRLEWHRSARDLYNLVRAVTHPYPGAFTTWRDRRLFVWRAQPLDGPGGGEPGEVVALGRDGGLAVATGSGTLVLQQVQLAGEPPERGDELARRLGPIVGERLGGGERC